MNQLKPIEHKKQRVLTTNQIAEGYGTTAQIITNNFNRNKTRYRQGKHYFMLAGDDLKQFAAKNQIDLLPNANRLALWTEKGALLHAKSLNTDKAWEVYDHLVETYFRARDMFQIPKTLPEALRMAAELAEQIEKDRPKVLFADKCLKSNESILIRELAKIACENGFEIGEKGLFKRLREWGLLMSNNEPYQRFMRYFEVVERPYPTYSGAKLSRTTKVLPRGQAYILNRLEKERQAS